MGKIKNFLERNRVTLQLIYGIILIVLIPSLIGYNTVKIVSKYNNSVDASITRNALTFARSIYIFLKEDLDNENVIQNKINKLSEQDIGLKDIEVLAPAGDNFKVIASSNKENIGKVMNFIVYNTAWSLPDYEGVVTESYNLTKTAKGIELARGFNRDERAWQIEMPMRDDNGKKKAILTMKLSSKIIDDLTKQASKFSFYILLFTVLIVILFLSAAVRLWDYALLYKKIKEVDQMKDEFISIASHELRTPVTGIKGYVSMVLDGTFGEINDKLKETMKMVQGASDRLGVLVEDLLNVSRIEQGRFKMDKNIIEISQIIKDIIAELKVQSDKKNLKLEYKPHADKLPLINVDADRFKQVLINLIGNAIKYTEKGSVEVLTEIQDKGRMLEIKVKDTGIGMSAKAQKRLFEKFYRVQSDKTKNITGTGLGLWITKKIVEMMRGEIMVSSIENTGTQVTLRFPIVNNK